MALNEDSDEQKSINTMNVVHFLNIPDSYLLSFFLWNRSQRHQKANFIIWFRETAEELSMCTFYRMWCKIFSVRLKLF